jgi:hypothetical protein
MSKEINYVYTSRTIKQQIPVCEVRLFGNDDLVITLSKTPNIFHRKMMEVFFGFKFKKICKES